MSNTRRRVQPDPSLSPAAVSRLHGYFTGASKEEPADFGAWTRSGQLDGLTLAEVLRVGRPQIRSRVFRDCHFKSWRFADTDVADCEFTNCLFDRCEWSYGRLANCVIRASEFKHCELYAVRFEGESHPASTLEDVTLTNCKLRHSMLHRSTWRNCIWTDCNTTSVECDAPRLINLKVKGSFHQVFMRGALHPLAQKRLARPTEVDSLYEIDLSEARVSDCTIFPSVVLDRVTPPSDGHCVLLSSRSAAREQIKLLLGRHSDPMTVEIAGRLDVMLSNKYSEWALLTKNDLFASKHLSSRIASDVWQVLVSMAIRR
jgi:uncharacterized protein YjbI with pentapeptide repeats